MTVLYRPATLCCVLVGWMLLAGGLSPTQAQSPIDINDGTRSASPRSFAVVDSTIYFGADGGAEGRALWRTDGTAAGTRLVKDIDPTGTRSSVGPLFNLDGQLLFFAEDGTNGKELWTSDGTSGGTRLVKDIADGTAPDQLTEVGGTLFFEVDKLLTNESELWKSGGTAGTTEPVKTITGSRLASLTAVGSTLYFASDGDPGQLWKSDGTTEGTVELAALPGSSSRVRNITPVGEAVFFAGRDDTHGEELWASAGTPATTGLVKDLYPGTEGSNPSRFVKAGGRLLFSAEGQSVGRELWTTGPTQALALAAGDTPEQALPALDLTIDVAQAGSAFRLLAFRDPNVTTASLPDGQALAAKGLWTVRAGDPGSVEAELCFGLDRLTAPRSAIDFTRLRVYRRADASSAWSRIADADVRLREDGTAPDPDAVCATVTSFSEFAVTAAPSALPVELTSFEGRQAGSGVVQLQWRTAGEQNNAGFRVERQRIPPSGGGDAGDDWTRIGTVETKAAGGTTTEALTYRFRDADVPFAAGTLRYRLRQVDTDGTTSRLGVVTVARGTVDELTLKAPYPNPAQTTVTAKLAIPETRSGAAHLSLYNALGQKVRTMRVDDRGRQRIELRTDGLASGPYFLRLSVGDAVETQRVTVVR